MATTVSITEAARNLSEFINRVAYRKEKFILVRGNRSVAELGPVNNGKPLSELAAIFRAIPKLDDKEIKEFKADLDAIRNESANENMRDIWPS